MKTNNPNNGKKYKKAIDRAVGTDKEKALRLKRENEIQKSVKIDVLAAAGKREMSIRQLAIASGVTYTHTLSVLSGEGNMSLQTLSNFCAILDCEIKIVPREHKDAEKKEE